MMNRPRAFRSDRGAVLVLVAVWMASAVALVTFVVDVGHWFEHKRHLQVQADAGALAAGDLFNKCITASAADRASSSSTANQTLITEARKYSGDTVNYASALNAQVNNRSNVTVLINSDKFANDGGTDFSDPKGPPCQAEYVDVKATDASLPWFFANNLVSGGLQLIHGYSTTSVGTLTNPVVRNVSLYNVTCSDNSAPYFVVNGGCTFGVRAQVDFGTGATPPPGAQVKVDRSGGGDNCPNSGSDPQGGPLTHNTG